jgi:hypothetical protein
MVSDQILHRSPRGEGEQGLMDDLIKDRHVSELLSEAGQAESTRNLSDPMVLCDRVRDALARRSDTALEIAEEAVRTCPGEFELLLLAALAALAVGQSVRAQVILKRHQKRYVPGKAVSLLNALGPSRDWGCHAALDDRSAHSGCA